MHIFHYLKDWLWPSEEPCTETNAPESLASSFVSVSHPEDQEEPEVQSIVTDLLRLSTELSGKTDLRPCDNINNLFGELVGLCTWTVSERVVTEVLNNAEVIEVLPGLRRICTEGESHLESHWADIITGTENQSQDEDTVFKRLMEFPYFNNYVDLTRLELAAIHCVHPTPISKLAFIGSGPLPLTSLQLLQMSPSVLEILNIDHNRTAISQSSKLCENLGSKGEGMHFLCAEAGSCDLRDFDVVYLAALVGSTQVEKEELLKDVVAKMREGAILVIRSAHGLRRVLYAVFDPTTVAMRRCLDLQLVVHPYNHVVNSVIIGRVRG
ncbi:nicotianamine synthase 3 [Hyaloscypha hepaticicola]|uniref:Nicotianamine synthase 3 n=1 Tax=Hyaloscypha hepaticicola TaxID=2082293 RepID=A0A2J6PSD0_9HELO|nr:nicotianamine synthase 3 [Hyaloscypha hepaticicola]